MPQQIFIPGLNIPASNGVNSNSNTNNKFQATPVQTHQSLKFQPQKGNLMEKKEFPFNLNDLQINDIFNMFNSQSLSKQQQQQQPSTLAGGNLFVEESTGASSTGDSSVSSQSSSQSAQMMSTPNSENVRTYQNKIVPKPELLEQHNNDIERFKKTIL